MDSFEEMLQQKWIHADECDDDFAAAGVAYASHILTHNSIDQAIENVKEVCSELKDARKYSDALSLYEALLQRIDADTQSDFAKERIEVLMNKGICFEFLDRTHEAIHAFTSVVIHADDEEALTVVDALVRLGRIFVDLDRPLHGIAHFDEVLAYDGFSKATDEIVGEALLEKAAALQMCGWDDRALATYDQLAERHANDSPTALKLIIARGILNKGRLLAFNGDDAKAADTLGLIIQLFESEPDERLTEIAKQASTERGWALRRSKTSRG